MKKLFKFLPLVFLLLILTAMPGWSQGAAHANHLTWVASTTSGITAYKVYRSTVSGGPYTAIATLGVVTAYDDTNTIQGVTHFYVVTAMVGTNESVFSNQTSAVDAGTNVNPPTGLQDVPN